MTSSRTLVLLVPAAAALVLGADALAGGGKKEPPPAAPDVPPVIEITVPDSAGPGGAAPLDFGKGPWQELEGWVSTVGGGRILTPAVDGERVFAGSGVEMHCFMVLGGKRGWSTKVDDSAPTAPAVADGHVYFNTASCTLYDLEAATGERRWSAWVAGSVATTPAISGGKVFVSGPAAEGGWKLEAYEAKGGKFLFKALLKSDLISAPVAEGGRIYYALTNGTLGAFTDEGKPIWETASRAVSAPVPAEGRLLVASAGEDGVAGLLDVDAATGTPTGRSVATPPSNPEKQGMAGGDIGNRGGGGPGAAAPRPGPTAAPKDPVRDRPNGAGKGGKSPGARGRGNMPPAPSAPPSPPVLPGVGGFGYEGPRPVVSGRVAALAGSDSLLLRGLDGAMESRLPVGDGPAGPPAAAGDLLVLATRGGRLLLVDPAAGTVRFEMRLRSPSGRPVPFASSPSVSRGRAFLGTDDGRILAFDLPEPGLSGWPMWGGGPGRGK